MKNEANAQSPTAEEEQPTTTAPEPPLHTKSSGLASDWQQSSQPVFVVEDSFYRSRTPPRPVHWSIAWSDLMMTMFILFLTLFVHLRTHQEILSHGKPNKIADETLPVQVDNAASSLIFHPISQDVSLKISDAVQEIVPPTREQSGADVLIRHNMADDKPQAEPQVEPLAPIPEVAREQQPLPPQVETGPATPPEPAVTPQETKQEELITKIYDLSKVTLEKEKLERFASVELIPDKTMRIILTGDLLFASGQAELTPNASNALKKISGIIQKTPYMINVIGHTDDRPVKNARFPSNWELSLARAGRVARFLIDDTRLPATQFSVSGYSSFRPLQPNTSEANRKINRRVEIVLSKELPQVQAATPATLQ